MGSDKPEVVGRNLLTGDGKNIYIEKVVCTSCPLVLISQL